MDHFLQALASVKNNPNVWAQWVHFSIGLIALLISYRAGERRRFWILGAAILLGALVIEIFYDPRYEHSPFFWDGALDMLSYTLGVTAGFLIDKL